MSDINNRFKISFLKCDANSNNVTITLPISYEGYYSVGECRIDPNTNASRYPAHILSYTLSSITICPNTANNSIATLIIVGF